MEKVFVSMTFTSEYGERTVNFRRIDFSTDEVVEILDSFYRKKPTDKRLIAVKKAFDTLFVSINNNDFYDKLPEKSHNYNEPEIF